jgi:putative protein kinase ArgK-like GTPase of G3E family
MRLKSTLLLCSISLLALVGCGQPPTTQASQSASPAASATAPTQAGYPELSSVVAKTQAAVEANDFEQAKTEFDQFESVWKPVEDGIKEKSAESYDAIEQDMDAVNAALRSAKADQAMTALKAMSEHIQSTP